MKPDAQDRYAVIGHPVAHSRSPFIHGEFARATGQAMTYTRLECPIDGFEGVLRGFAASGARGCNVTLPFKFDTPRLAARISARSLVLPWLTCCTAEPAPWLP